MPNSRIIDLSHWNTVPESLQPAADAGVWGVVHKGSQGITVVDDKLASRAYLAKQAGLLFGTYQFVDTSGSMAEQVAHYVDTVSNAQGEAGDAQRWLWALDWEVEDVSLDNAVAFMEQLEEATGRMPVLYSGHVVKDALQGTPDDRLSRYRLWLAQYASKPTLPPGWPSYWIWQWTDQGEVPGIGAPTDCNDYQCDREQLAQEWTGAESAPKPPKPDWKPSKVIVGVRAPKGVEVEVWLNGQPVNIPQSTA